MFIARLYLVMLSVWCMVWGSLDRLVMWWVRRWYTLYISITNVTRMAQNGIIWLVIFIAIVSILRLAVELLVEIALVMYANGLRCLLGEYCLA